MLRVEGGFRGGLALKARRLVFQSALGWRVIKKKKKVEGADRLWGTGRGTVRAEDAEGTPTQVY